VLAIPVEHAAKGGSAGTVLAIICLQGNCSVVISGLYSSRANPAAFGSTIEIEAIADFEGYEVVIEAIAKKII